MTDLGQQFDLNWDKSYSKCFQYTKPDKNYWSRRYLLDLRWGINYEECLFGLQLDRRQRSRLWLNMYCRLTLTELWRIILRWDLGALYGVNKFRTERAYSIHMSLSFPFSIPIELTPSV